MSLRSPSRFDRLAPVSDRYATLPVADAFTWEACAADVEPGEWYMVAFRSIRRPDVDEDAPDGLRRLGPRRSEDAPGFVHYFKGPTQPDGRCMSFCLWDSRAEARAAAGRPAHLQAAAITHETYAEYTLEFHRVAADRRTAASQFEVYDESHAWQIVVPKRPRVLKPRLAPS